MKKFEVTIEIEISEDHPAIGADGDIAGTVLEMFQDFLDDDSYLNVYFVTVQEQNS